jgi:hypothetical protein
MVVIWYLTGVASFAAGLWHRIDSGAFDAQVGTFFIGGLVLSVGASLLQEVRDVAEK